MKVNSLVALSVFQLMSTKGKNSYSLIQLNRNRCTAATLGPHSPSHPFKSNQGNLTKNDPVVKHEMKSE